MRFLTIALLGLASCDGNDSVPAGWTFSGPADSVDLDPGCFAPAPRDEGGGDTEAHAYYTVFNDFFGSESYAGVALGDGALDLAVLYVDPFASDPGDGLLHCVETEPGTYPCDPIEMGRASAVGEIWTSDDNYRWGAFGPDWVNEIEATAVLLDEDHIRVTLDQVMRLEGEGAACTASGWTTLEQEYVCPDCSGGGFLGY